MTQQNAKNVLLKNRDNVPLIPYVNPASTSEAGVVKIDGTTITMSDGVISATSSTANIDQTYNPASSNAQSGVAIANAGFLTSHQSLSGYVQTSRTINSKALSSDITLTASDVGAATSSHTHSTYVPTTRTINSKALSSNISLTASDVGAATSSHTHSTYVPTSRTINSKALSANITLTASDVGAATSSHTHSDYASSSHTHSDYVPTTRTINSKALSSDITLSASDVGAATSSHTHSELDNKTILSLSGSGTLSLTANRIHKVTQSGAITFSLPTGSTTEFRQIQVMIKANGSSVTLGTTNYFNGKTPSFTANTYYTLIYEYDAIKSAWTVGCMSHS